MRGRVRTEKERLTAEVVIGQGREMVMHGDCTFIGISISSSIIAAILPGHPAPRTSGSMGVGLLC